MNAPVPPPAAKTTSYVILSRLPSSADDTSATRGMWKLESSVAATSSDAAIKAWAEDKAKDGIELVAVPARSWQPRKITVETVSKVSLS